jgi:hypothetical protein
MVILPNPFSTTILIMAFTGYIPTKTKLIKLAQLNTLGS